MQPIVQISASRIPGHAANSIQTIKMAEALKGLCGEIHLVACIENSAEFNISDRAAAMAFYGVRDLPNIQLFQNKGRFGIHVFNLRAALYARKLKPTLVLSRSIGAAAVCTRMGLPTVWECHAPPQGVENLYWRWLATARCFRRLVVISHGLRRIISERYPEAENMDVVVANDGVDLARFEDLPDAVTAKASAGIDPRRPVAGYAGHLYSGRGLDVLLDCAQALPHWNFVIAGGTEENVTQLKALLARRTITNVNLWGFVPNAELASRLAIADVLLMPYQKSVMVSGGTLDTARWMSPLKMFEYMAMGRAIISSDLPVLREVLDDNMARLVAPDNTQSWIEALRSLESDGPRVALAQNALAAAQQYGWDRRTNRMIADLLPINQ